ncbi:hypothetical protein OIU77_031281 [Salix suchowensis]|uniref:Exostosin GT47 domain-containing protein n=1 Tax=Salix suchowensis TaxID=1278906 RepID=A0ABQ9BEY3_9ROSI|nr:hypothetical protein OIU77_031281 [Salix suchowensis]
MICRDDIRAGRQLNFNRVVFRWALSFDITKDLGAGNGELLTHAASSISEIVSNTTQSNEGISGLNNSSGIDNHGKESKPEQLVDRNENSSLEPVNSLGNGSASQETERSLSRNDIGASNARIAPIAPELLPVDSTPSITLPSNSEPSVIAPIIPVEFNTSKVDKDAAPKVKKEPQTPSLEVVSISEMNNLQLQRWSSPNSRTPRWPSVVDQELLNAKSQIQNAPIVENDPALYAPLYWNISMFKRSYELMEDILKVYIYKEGEMPILHQPLLKGIYASEGWFMKLLEGNKKFVTKDSRKAHLFYLPFSSRNLEIKLYVPDSHSHKNLIQYLKNYLDMISAKYPFWNRTQGADHFLVACHDWAPSETRQHMANCIRALCNSDAKEDFVFGKDASLPETYVLTPQNPLRDLGGKRASKRSILAFFAGSMHGYLRPILLQHWENKDPDMKIFGKLPKVKNRGKMNYIRYMQSSKYCICAKGYEVNSPRVVEAIFYECVPVIISDNFVPPFLEVLNWESFAVFVLEKDIPNLKNILLSIPEKKYRRMQMRVKRLETWRHEARRDKNGSIKEVAQEEVLANQRKSENYVSDLLGMECLGASVRCLFYERETKRGYGRLYPTLPRVMGICLVGL